MHSIDIFEQEAHKTAVKATKNVDIATFFFTAPVRRPHGATDFPRAGKVLQNYRVHL